MFGGLRSSWPGNLRGGGDRILGVSEEAAWSWRVDLEGTSDDLAARFLHEPTGTEELGMRQFPA